MPANSSARKLRPRLRDALSRRRLDHVLSIPHRHSLRVRQLRSGRVRERHRSVRAACRFADSRSSSVVPLRVLGSPDSVRVWRPARVGPCTRHGRLQADVPWAWALPDSLRLRLRALARPAGPELHRVVQVSVTFRVG